MIAAAKHFGVISQDVEHLFRELVSQEEGEVSTKFVNYSMFGILAIQTLKEQ